MQSIAGEGAMKKRKSLWERYESHAIYDTKSPRKKPKPQLTESQVPTFGYVEALRRTVANRMRIAR